MKKETYEFRVKRIQAINKIIQGLEPEIRASSFELLKEYITDDAASSERGSSPAEENTQAPRAADREEFFAQFERDKPADNALLIAAWHFNLYGSEPISTEEVKEAAADIGITIPDRVDNTMRYAQRNKKKLFRSAGKGKYRPTVHGESFLKAEYGVAKGTTRKDTEANE